MHAYHESSVSLVGVGGNMKLGAWGQEGVAICFTAASQSIAIGSATIV